MANGCRILLLGPVELLCEGRPLRLPTQRSLALVAFLALQETPQERARLATLLWDAPDGQARHRLRQELYRLGETPLGRFLTSDRRQVGLSGVESDAAEFLRALEQGRWEHATRLWRGEFMAGFELSGSETFEDWLALERASWRDRYLLAQSRLALQHEAAGEAEAAARAWERVLEEDPLHEEALRRLLVLLARAGRWEEAERRYAAYRERLESELGLEPDAETERLFAQLRARKAPARPAAAPVPPSLARPPLVGREALLARLEALAPAPALLSGDAGAGKTRLAREHLAARGGRLIVQHPASSRNLPFAGVVRALEEGLDAQGVPELDPVWLREAGRLLPHRLPRAEQPLASAADQARFLEGLSRVLLALSGPVLVWDDLQWTDPAALELLAYLLPLAEREGVQLIVTARTPLEPGPARDWLQPLLAAGLTELAVPPLDEDALHELIKKLAHQRYGARLFARRLHQATGGNPFFALETLRHLFASGELRLRSGGWSTPYDRTTEDYHELPLPTRVRDLLTARVRALDPPLRRALDLAAVARRPLEPETLARLLGLGELEAVQRLERLREQQLLTREGRGYAPVHDHLRSLLRQEQGAALARTYHRALARALELDGAPGEAAEHWLEAGEPERAASGFLAAARAAGENPLSALTYYRRALELDEGLDAEARRAAELETLALEVRLGRLDPAGLERLRQLAGEGDAPALLLLAEALLQRGDYPEALATAERGLAGAKADGDVAAEARAHFLLAWIYYRHGDPEAQLGELESALAAYRRLGDRGGAARVLRNLAALHFRLGHKEEGDRLQAEAERLARAAGDAVLALRIQADRATGHWLRGAYPEVRAEARKMRNRARKLGDVGGELDALELEGLAALRLGAFEAALRAFDEAVRRAEALRLEKDDALARSERALALIELGRYDEARADLERALAIQRRIGDQAKLGHTFHTFGYLHLRRGEARAAEARFLEAAEHWRRRGERGHLARALAYAALAARAQDAGKRARQLAAEAYAASQDWPVGVPERPLVLAVYGRLQDDARALEEARSELKALERRLGPRQRERLRNTFLYRTVFDL